MIRRSIVFVLALVLVLATAPGVVAKAHGTDRPFRADISGEIYWTFDQTDPQCPVQTVGDAWGLATHLGRVAWHSMHCPPVVLPTYSIGQLVFTAADGDELTADYDVNGDAPYYAEITGGTGRFADASGRLEFYFVITWGPWDENGPVAPWYADWHFTGTISY